jgi:hypothetical protein
MKRGMVEKRRGSISSVIAPPVRKTTLLYATVIHNLPNFNGLYRTRYPPQPAQTLAANSPWVKLSSDARFGRFRWVLVVIGGVTRCR